MDPPALHTGRGRGGRCGYRGGEHVSPASVRRRTRLPRVIVVGAGIAGLNAAYQLKKAGVEATVFEARSRLGGRILSLRGAIGDGLVTDLGGLFINSDHGDMLSLVDEFDLKLFNRLADVGRLPVPRAAYYFDGRRRDEEEVAEALRPIAEQITRMPIASTRTLMRLRRRSMHFRSKNTSISNAEQDRRTVRSGAPRKHHPHRVWRRTR